MLRFIRGNIIGEIMRITSAIISCCYVLLPVGKEA